MALRKLRDRHYVRMDSDLGGVLFVIGLMIMLVVLRHLWDMLEPPVVDGGIEERE